MFYHSRYKKREQWQQSAAAVLFVASIGFVMSSISSHAQDLIKSRSIALMPEIVRLDSEVSKAISIKSLDKLYHLNDHIIDKTRDAEKHIESGGSGTACDLALSDLRIITAYAINKLDKTRPYEAWMKEESYDLLSSYQKMVGNCSLDGALKAPKVQMSKELLRGL